MKAVSKFFAGAAVAAVAAGGLAAPAAAQYYPPYGGGGYGSGNVIVGAILDSILRGGSANNGRYGNQYGYGYQNERYAIDQCARATESRLNGYNRGNRNPYGYGYNTAGFRVVQIERVERRRSGATKVWGLAGRGGYAGNYGGYGGGYGAPYGGGYGAPYGGGYGAPYGGGYGAPYGYNAAPEFRFACTIDSRGRISDLDLNRNRYAGRYGY